MGNLTFNGISTNDYGIVVQTFPSYEFPSASLESVTIEGRDGDLYINKNSYKNVERTYYLASEVKYNTNFASNANRLVSWFKSVKSYARLEDSYEPDYYRMAIYKDGGTVNNIFNEAYTLEARFICKPQRYLKRGDMPLEYTSLSQSTTIRIKNETQFASLPLISFTASSAYLSSDKTISFYYYKDGVRTLQTTVTILPDLEEGIINSDMQDCYSNTSGLTNINNKISLTYEFPELNPGINEIVINSPGIEYLKIIPKWWTL